MAFLRRLEVALGAFGREFGQDWIEELRGRAKILLGRLSPARDLDVFTSKLLASPSKSGVGEGLPQLRTRAEAARDTAWGAALASISSTDFEHFTDDVAALAGSQLPLTRDRKLKRTARRILNRQNRRVRKARAGGQKPGRGRSSPLAHRAQEAALPRNSLPRCIRAATSSLI